MDLFHIASAAIEDDRSQHWVLPTLASVLIHALVLVALPRTVPGSGFENPAWRPDDLRHAPLLVSIRAMVTERTPDFSATVPNLSGEPQETLQLDKPGAVARILNATDEPAAGSVTTEGIPGRGGDDCRVSGFRFCSS